MSFEIYGPDPTVLDISGRKSHVLIIGAGLAGLTLGIMLQKAGIPFDIFEKSPEAGAVGSALFLAPQVCPIFKDLGILDQYLDHSIPCTSIHFFNQDCQPDFQLDFQLYNELTGCEGRIIPHATLHALLLSQIPSSRIHTSKRLLWYTQGENGVQVRFSDGKTFDGDILVGADGPTSAVRQCLYESLRKRNKLARKDRGAVKEGRESGMAIDGGGGGKRSVCLVGQTEPLDRRAVLTEASKAAKEDGKEEKEGECRFYNTRSNDQPYSWNTMTCKDGSISWSITQHSPPSSSPSTPSTATPSSASFPSPLSNLDWSSDGVAVESITTQIRAFPIPCPFMANTDTSNSNSNTSNSNNNDNYKTKVTLGDLIDKTPRDRMTKVVIEERMFETWYYCRTILIGDACHKLNPAGNQGAHLSILDAHTLSHHISTLTTTQLKHLTPAFKAHKSIRLPPTQRAWLLSRALAKLGGGNGNGGGVGGKVLRKLPPWAWRKVFERLVGSPGDRKGAGGDGGNRVLKATSGSTVSLSREKEDDDEDDEKVVQEAVAAVRSVSLEDEDDQDEGDVEGDDDYEDGDYGDDAEGRDGRSTPSSSQQQTATVAVSSVNYTPKDHKQTLK